jgi:hypothetical protein
VHPVEPGEQVKLLALVGLRHRLVLHELDQLLDVGVLAIDVGALEHAGQEPGLPVLVLLQRVPARAHRHEPGRFWFSVPSP